MGSITLHPDICWSLWTSGHCRGWTCSSEAKCQSLQIEKKALYLYHFHFCLPFLLSFASFWQRLRFIVFSFLLSPNSHQAMLKIIKLDCSREEQIDNQFCRKVWKFPYAFSALILYLFLQSVLSASKEGDWHQGRNTEKHRKTRQNNEKLAFLKSQERQWTVMQSTGWKVVEYERDLQDWRPETDLQTFDWFQVDKRSPRQTLECEWKGSWILWWHNLSSRNESWVCWLFSHEWTWLGQCW